MIQDRILKGQIEGVEYYFKDLGESGGRKNVLHQFINSDKVIGEDMGRDKKSFTLEIYISGVSNYTSTLEDSITSVSNSVTESIKDNYYERKSAMLAVLNKEGAISLIHPTRGFLKVMQSSRYSLNENLTSLNKCNISVSFVEVDNEIQNASPKDFSTSVSAIKSFQLSSGGILNSVLQDPSQFVGDGFNVENVSNLRNNVFDRGGWVINDTLEMFGISADFLKSSESVLQNVGDIQEIMTTSLQYLAGTKDLSDIFRQIESLSFLNTGSDLVNIGLEIGRVFVAVENSIEDSNQRYNFFKAFFDYNDNFEEKQVLTATSEPNIQTRENEVLFRDYIQALGSSYAGNALADYDYATEDELNQLSEEIETQLLKQLENQKDNTEIYNLIQRQRVVIKEQLEKSRLTTRRVITVKVVNSSLTNICYSYYQSLELFDNIQALNDFYNPSNISGDIKILSGGDL